MIRECEEEAAPVYDVRMLVMLSLIMVMMLVMMLVMMVMMVLSMMMVMMLVMMVMMVLSMMMVMMLVMMKRSRSSEQVSKKSSQFVLCHLVQPYSSRGILDGDGGIRW